MGFLPGARLLGAWERGLAEDGPRRALVLLQLAEPNRTIDELAALPVGERDRRLLELRGRAIGELFEATARCPECGEQLEVRFSGAELLASLPDGASDPIEVSTDGYTVKARAPSTADLLEAVRTGSRESAREWLLGRCVVSVHHGGREAVGTLPEAVAAAVEARLAELDPAANLEVALRCPGCSHAWNAPLDVGAYLWSEISDRAKRLLRETHALARAYGWREADILAMSEWRRQSYLELVGET